MEVRGHRLPGPMEVTTKPVSEGVLGRGLAPSSPQRNLEDLASGLERRVPGAAGHARRVARLSGATAKRMGLRRREVARVRRAALLHDIGKLETPAAVINKPGPLDAEEFTLIKRHTIAGERMVDRLGDPELAAIVRHHHERFDGKGYPDGLAGEEIPLGARIVAVADTFDALTSVRPYRPASRSADALDLLSVLAGEQLDPDVVEAFADCHSGPRAVLLRALAR
jgi:two-component system, cell cycle response regulator